MNRVTSSSNAQKKKLPQSQSQPHPPPPAKKKDQNLKRERLSANPSRVLSIRSSGSNVSGSVLTTSSEGCHRSLLSHSFSSSSSTCSSLGVSNRPLKAMVKTPKSDPVVSKPLVRKKPRHMKEEETKLKSNLKLPQRCTFGKKSDKVSVLKKQTFVSKELKLKDRKTSVRVDDSIVRIASPACDDSSYEDRTPPVQASVSPEIQCGSSLDLSVSAKSQACYAAGHLLSGVSDKRKCKPKAILTVGENSLVVGKAKLLNDFDEFSNGDFGCCGSYDNVSTMPLPVDASVRWLLSPCDEEKEKCDEDFSRFECVGQETSSPLSDRSTSSDLCNISSGRSLSPNCKETIRRISSSLSPNELSRFRRFMDLSSFTTTTPTCELVPSNHSKGDKPSPLSFDTLGSENVIQTPESNSSFDNCFGLSSPQPEIQKKHSLVGSDLESLTMTFQSAALSPRSQVSSREPDTSSFNFDSLATSSVSVDLSQFQSIRAPGKVRKLLPCSAAESISTDASGLVCSEDSNWMECYKNNFVDE